MVSRLGVAAINRAIKRDKPIDKELINVLGILHGIQDDFNRKGLLSETGQVKDAWYVLRDWYSSR